MREKGKEKETDVESGSRAVKETVRQRLLAGAADLFSRKGYAATTVRELVTLAGVTKPVLYYYFKSKEGIYLELMQEAFAKADQLLDSSLEEAGSAEQKLRHLCLQAFSLFLENIKAVRVMYSIYYGPPQGAPFFDFDAYHMKFRQAVRQLIEEGMQREEFRRGDAEGLTWLVLGAINVAMEVQLGSPEIRMGKEDLTRVLDLIFQRVLLSRPKEEGL